MPPPSPRSPPDRRCAASCRATGGRDSAGDREGRCHAGVVGGPPDVLDRLRKRPVGPVPGVVHGHAAAGTGPEQYEVDALVHRLIGVVEAIQGGRAVDAAGAADACHRITLREAGGQVRIGEACVRERGDPGFIDPGIEVPDHELQDGVIGKGFEDRQRLSGVAVPEVVALGAGGGASERARFALEVEAAAGVVGGEHVDRTQVGCEAGPVCRPDRGTGQLDVGVVEHLQRRQDHLLVGEVAVVDQQFVGAAAEVAEHRRHQSLLTGADLLEGHHVGASEVVIDPFPEQGHAGRGTALVGVGGAVAGHLESVQQVDRRHVDGGGGWFGGRGARGGGWLGGRGACGACGGGWLGGRGARGACGACGGGRFGGRGSDRRPAARTGACRQGNQHQRRPSHATTVLLATRRMGTIGVPPDMDPGRQAPAR